MSEPVAEEKVYSDGLLGIRAEALKRIGLWAERNAVKPTFIREIEVRIARRRGQRGTFYWKRVIAICEHGSAPSIYFTKEGNGARGWRILPIHLRGIHAEQWRSPAAEARP